MKLIFSAIILLGFAASLNSFLISPRQTSDARTALHAAARNYGFGARITKESQPVEKVQHHGQVIEEEVITVPSTANIVEEEEPIMEIAVEVPIQSKVPDSNAIVPTVFQSEPITAEVVTTASGPQPTQSIESNTPITEEMLKQQILDEKRMRDRRVQEMSKLQSRLSQSIARKMEVESTIVSEIEMLRNSIITERDSETQRLSQLEGLFENFKNVLLAKRSILESERKVLAQMVDVRAKIFEQTILDQLDAAVSKKECLIRIEENICDDIMAGAEEINLQIADTNAKIASLKVAMQNLPREGDAAAARAYSWQEIEDLQQTLLRSLEDSPERDTRIRNFIGRFDELMQRRGIVLGVNTQLPPMVAASMPVTSAKTVEAEVVYERSTPRAMKRVVLQEEEDLLQANMEALTQAQLSVAALAAVKQSATSFAGVSTGLLDAARNYWNSLEGKESRKSLGNAFENITKAGQSLQNSLKAVGVAWNNEIGDEATIESTDEYVQRLIKAVKNVFTSQDVRGALKETSSSLSSTVSELSTASKLTVSKVNDELKSNDEWNSSVQTLSQALTSLIKVITAGAKNFLQTSDISRQLPSPSTRKDRF